VSEERSILVADIVDGTQHFDRLRDTLAVEHEKRCLALMRDVVESTGGTVFRHVGDQIDCAYASPDEAAEGANRLRRRALLAKRNGVLPQPLHLRMGFEHGPVVKQDDVYTGGTVIVATRLSQLAKAGEILTTDETRRRMTSARADAMRHLTDRVLKGHREARAVYGILPEEEESGSTTVIPGLAPTPHLLELRQGKQTWTLGPERSRLDIGRTSSADVSIKSPLVSRVHARLFWQPDQIEFEDQSANGSYVSAGDDWVRVHRARTVLSGTGRISLGPPHLDEKRSMLRFTCVPIEEAR
jgi:class 3 adenylate cyclase